MLSVSVTAGNPATGHDAGPEVRLSAPRACCVPDAAGNHGERRGRSMTTFTFVATAAGCTATWHSHDAVSPELPAYGRAHPAVPRPGRFGRPCRLHARQPPRRAGSAALTLARGTGHRTPPARAGGGAAPPTAQPQLGAPLSHADDGAPSHPAAARARRPAYRSRTGAQHPARAARPPRPASRTQCSTPRGRIRPGAPRPARPRRGLGTGRAPERTGAPGHPRAPASGVSGRPRATARRSCRGPGGGRCGKVTTTHSRDHPHGCRGGSRSTPARLSWLPTATAS
jgi:hypothetical protein